MNTNVSPKRILSKILAVSLVIGGSVSAQKGMRNNRTQRSLRERNMYSIRKNIRNSRSFRNVTFAKRKSFEQSKQSMAFEKGKKNFSPMEFWSWLAAMGVLSGSGLGTISHFATKKLNNDKQNCYLYLAEKLGILSEFKRYADLHGRNVTSMVNSIMPVYDELCSFASNLSLDFDPEKLEAKFGIKDIGNEFYKSHVSVFNFLKSWTFKFKIGKQTESQDVDHVYVDNIECSYPDNYKKWKGTRFLKFEDNSWKFIGGYGFSQPVPKAYEDASMEQKKNLRCGTLNDYFKNLACDVVSEWLLCMWIYPVYNDEGIFDCCINRVNDGLCFKFISNIMKANGLF